eukprot:SM000586S18608  [mRNA]  locus=s586:147:2745:+ [translate_table: standard]
MGRPLLGGAARVFLYAASGQEKEGWCAALRAAARGESMDAGAGGGSGWHAELRKEYLAYVARIRRLYTFWYEAGGDDDNHHDVPTALTAAAAAAAARPGRHRLESLRSRFRSSGGHKEVTAAAGGGGSGRGREDDGDDGERQQHRYNWRRLKSRARTQANASLRSRFRHSGGHKEAAAAGGGGGGSSRGREDDGDDGERQQHRYNWRRLKSRARTQASAVAAPTAAAHGLLLQAAMSSATAVLPGAQLDDSKSTDSGPLSTDDEDDGGGGSSPAWRPGTIDGPPLGGSGGIGHIEAGVQCVNVLFARMFFDLYRSPRVSEQLRSRIQVKLSRTVTPSYMGPLTCTHYDVGNVPPLARAMRVRPLGPGGEIAVDADVEWHAGAVLTIQTRLDARELSFLQHPGSGGGASSSSGSAASLDGPALNRSATSVTSEEGSAGSMEAAASRALEAVAMDGAGPFGTQSRSDDGGSNGDREPAAHRSGRGGGGAFLGRVRALVSAVAEQVSAVPLTLRITCRSLRGTVRLHMAPPPSDRLWFGFVDMPELDLLAEPSVGELRITANPMASFILERIKARPLSPLHPHSRTYMLQLLIRDALVLPQSEDLAISFMTADPDDWLAAGDIPA